MKLNDDSTQTRLQQTPQARPVDNPSNISKPATTVSELFLTDDNSANDTHTHSTRGPRACQTANRVSVRKAREAYLIERGKTLQPGGW